MTESLREKNFPQNSNISLQNNNQINRSNIISASDDKLSSTISLRTTFSDSRSPSCLSIACRR